MTAHLLQQRTERLMSDFRMLQLSDPEHSHLRTGPREGTPGEVGVAGTGIIQFSCPGEDPYPQVRFELWDSRPVEPAEEPGFEGDLDTENLIVVLGAPTAAPSDMVITLPAAGLHRVRAYRYDPEHWYIQMWPTPAT